MKKLFIALLLVLCLTSLAFAGEKQLRFTWAQTLSTDFGGWRLYMNTAPNVQVTSTNLFSTITYAGPAQTEYTETKILTSPDSQEVTYYFVLTAFDTRGNESGPSNEVNTTIDFLAPNNPNTLTVTVVSVP